jgi:dipeptidyl aminopeptidase/acylaminoacyl peptidase
MNKLLRLALLTSVAVGLSAAATAVHKYRQQQQLFFPRQAPIELPARLSGLAAAEDVRFEAAGTTLKGWYIPSKNGSAIVLLHGAGGNRADLLAEARALADRGFGVLLFDWPGHGESTGQIHWNDGERASLVAALDWLAKRADVSSPRVGAYGFSMGGYVVAQVAAADSRLAAVVLAGTPANQREQVAFQHRRLGLLGELPALYALRRGGMQVDRLMPIDEVSKIAPRSLLIVGGSLDAIVPPAMAPALYARAGEPKELLVIEGAGHGGYAGLGGSVYLDRLSAFFERALLGKGD